MDKTPVVILVAMYFVVGAPWHSNFCCAKAIQSGNTLNRANSPETNFAGPPPEVHPIVPPGSGFWSFSICVANVISRSGQPSMADFQWLKDNGWKGIVDLRNSSVANWPGFKELNFNYLSLPINDNSVPSDKQAQEFLEFVTSPYNQPVHIFCHAGIGRTGVMIALYRYMVQGWPMFIAILESRFRGNGMNSLQVNWLRDWAQVHKPGSFKSKPTHK